jgi:hypothetical protein
MKTSHWTFDLIRKAALFSVLWFVMTLLLFFTFEGLSSSVLIVQHAVLSRPLAERLHTQFDEELGWVNKPKVYIRDMYGPGVYLKINSQLFRNNEEFGLSVPSGKVRVVCLGDSFTLGYGVDNDHTWCHSLGSLNKQLETVNMGQGGYGVDQAYLWYKRDGTKLEHDILIFAFITDDFLRMEEKEFLGYPKPTLETKDGALVTRNVPVPHPSFYASWVSRCLATVDRFSCSQLIRKLFFRRNVVLPANNHATEVVAKIFQDLHQTNEAKKSVLVLVHLPTKQDFSHKRSDFWRQFLHAESQKNGLILIDLIDDFRNMSPREVQTMFFHEEDVAYSGAAGHYTEQGNAYIANLLYVRMLAIPEIVAKLQRSAASDQWQDWFRRRGTGIAGKR